MLHVYGHPLSTCTRKVLTTLAETHTPYELTVVDFAKGEHKQEPHLTRQPFGQVPAIDDDGFALYESRAIARYLNRKARGSLVPDDLESAARMEQWISIESTQFMGPVMKFIFHGVFQRPQPAEVLNEARPKVELTLDLLDTRLAGRPHLAGDGFSLADLFFMPYFAYAMATPLAEAIAARENVAAWWARISARPSWKKVAGGH